MILDTFVDIVGLHFGLHILYVWQIQESLSSNSMLKNCFNCVGVKPLMLIMNSGM